MVLWCRVCEGKIIKPKLEYYTGICLNCRNILLASSTAIIMTLLLSICWWEKICRSPYRGDEWEVQSTWSVWHGAVLDTMSLHITSHGGLISMPRLFHYYKKSLLNRKYWLLKYLQYVGQTERGLRRNVITKEHFFGVISGFRRM